MTLTTLELEFLEGAYEAVNEEGVPTAVVFNTYPSRTQDTDESTTAPGTEVPVPLNVSPPAPVVREFADDTAPGGMVTKETSRIFLPAWDGSAVMTFAPEQSIVGGMTVTWDSKTRQILAVEPAQVGETVVGWKVFTEN